MSDPVLETAEEALGSCQAELAEAEIAAIEATARAENARESVSRLKAAVAALNGESPPATAPKGDGRPVDAPEATKHEDTSDLTPEEFDAMRRKKRKKRQKEIDVDNPLAQYRCAGCGEMGTSEHLNITAPSGAVLQAIVCNQCGNQTF